MSSESRKASSCLIHLPQVSTRDFITITCAAGVTLFFPLNYIRDFVINKFSSAVRTWPATAGITSLLGIRASPYPPR
jgi:hypothetical protein